MTECPPLQHIAAVVISHNAELKGPLDLDIIEAFIFEKSVQICAGGAGAEAVPLHCRGSRVLLKIPQARGQLFPNS